LILPTDLCEDFVPGNEVNLAAFDLGKPSFRFFSPQSINLDLDWEVKAFKESLYQDDSFVRRKRESLFYYFLWSTGHTTYSPSKIAMLTLCHKQATEAQSPVWKRAKPRYPRL